MKISNKLILAPLRGVTGYVFRNAFSRHFPGFDEAYSPFITTVAGNRAAISHFREILPENKGTLPVVPQLIGNNPEDFLRMTEFIATTFGHTHLNWNLGCPFGTVTHKNRGSGLLPQVDRIAQFLDFVMPQTKCRISVKIRLGLTDPDDALRLLPVLNRYPLHALIVHPRTATQLYEGAVDLDRFRVIHQESACPVIYNGDIVMAMQHRAVTEALSPSGGIMIGRGAVMNPFIVDQIRRNSGGGNKIDRFRKFHDDLYAGFTEKMDGPAPLLGAMKELWWYWSHSFDSMKKTLKRIRKTTKKRAYEEIVNAFFETEAEWTGPQIRYNPFSDLVSSSDSTAS